MRIAVFPGSFDPVTMGHWDIIRRAAKLFDKLYICAMNNGGKNPLFKPEERLAMLKECVKDLPNVEAELWTGLLADYARARGARYLVKGVRNGTDFDMEYALAQINNSLNPELETVLLCAQEQYLHISSTMVREMIKYQQPLELYMPGDTAKYVKGWEEKNGKQ